ncbi:MAG TPA: MerR family transcriptional regulator [Jatrophihabitans sp.]|nr:MerR family transcriptional regulator [Jatrophihabitans sp.]
MDGSQMQIGEVAERTGLSINTIRHYDQAGLVTPSARTPGGFRLYTHTDIERLLVIRRMKPLGFTLEQMRQLLEITGELTAPEAPAGDRGRELRAMVRHYRELVEQRRRTLSKELAFAEEFGATLDSLVSPSAD